MTDVTSSQPVKFEEYRSAVNRQLWAHETLMEARRSLIAAEYDYNNANTKLLKMEQKLDENVKGFLRQVAIYGPDTMGWMDRPPVAFLGTDHD